MKEVDALEGSVSKLRAILDKKKKTAKDKAAKAMPKKDGPQKPGEKPEVDKEKGEQDEEKESENSNTAWKKKSPTKTTKNSEQT
jgi:hypothetical protein